MGNITFSFGSGLNDSIFGKSQAPIKALIESKAEAYEKQSMLKELFNHNPSKHFAEKYSTMTAMEGPKPVGEGGAYPVDGTQEGFSKTIENMVWKDSFSVTREAIDDSKILDLKKRPTMFTKGFFRVREEFGAAMLGGAVLGPSVKFRGRVFDTTGADGKPYFSKDHPYKLASKKTQSNVFAGDLTAANLGAMETRMQNFEGDAEEILAVAPKTILIPNDADLKNKALEAIGSDKDPGTSNNGFNYQYGRWNLIVWPYLNFLLKAGLKPWFLLDPDFNEEYDGAVWQNRVKLEVRSELDGGNDNNLWKGYERYGVGFNDFRAFAVGGIDGGTAL